MNDYLEFTIGLALISVAFLYLAWTKVRVVLLRQSLFEIRDNLWDLARQHDCLSDPGYCAARTHLNNIIWTAPILSVPALIAVRCETTLTKRPECANPVVQKAIEEAYRQSWLRLAHYVTFHRLSGWLAIAAIGTRKVVEEATRHWILSDGADSARNTAYA